MENSKERLPIEEIANCITHGFGLALSIVGLIVLIVLAAQTGSAWAIGSCAVYGASLVVLYTASTLYHSARTVRAKNLFQILDHCCIYLLIAGTYTPFMLILLRGSLGWTILSLVWGIAVAGVVTRIWFGDRFKVATLISYILLGWMGLVAIKPLLGLVPLSAIIWILGGGVAYSLGFVFYGWKRIPHNHAIWHIFVLVGSACHYLAVVRYVLKG